MNKVEAAIVTIGDELLIGQTIDTNSAWLGTELNKIGIWVNKRIAVGDKKNDIINAIDQASACADIILITGGLGPTADDITKPLLCAYFGGTLVVDKQVEAHVIQLFEQRGRKIIDINLKQAMVPNCCTVLFNEMGTAPGMLFEKENKTFISLPGVPFEMKHIMQQHGFSALLKKYNPPKVAHRTLVTAGQGESFIAQSLLDFENNLDAKIKLAYLPQLGTVKLRLSAIGLEESVLDQAFENLQQLVRPIMYAKHDWTLGEAVGDILLRKQLTLACAESCTAGAILSSLTNTPSSSNYVKGGIVAYQNEIKTNFLQIDQHILDQQGAVSEIVAEQMAINIRNLYNSDFGLSITGYLDQNNEAKQAYAYIGVANQKECQTKKIVLPYDRIRNKELAINIALNLLYRNICTTTP